MRRAVTAFAVLALVAAACTGSPDDSGGVTSTTTATTTTTGPPTTASSTTTSANLRPVGGTVRMFGSIRGTLNPYLELSPPDGFGLVNGENFAVLLPLVLGGVSKTDYRTGEIVPDLVTELPSRANGGLTANDDGSLTVRYMIDPKAVWSDGVPVTGDDFAFTYEIIQETAAHLAMAATVREEAGRLETELGRPPTPEEVTAAAGVSQQEVEGALGGFGLMTDCGAEYSVSAIDADQRIYDSVIPESIASGPDWFEYTLRDGGDYNDLLFVAILPGHAVDGTDLGADWNDRQWPSAGPFVVETWDAETGRTAFVRNQNYWKSDPATGQPLPYLDRIVLDPFIDEITGLVDDPDLRAFGRIESGCASRDDAAALLGLGPGIAAEWSAASLAAQEELFREGRIAEIFFDAAKDPDGIDVTAVISRDFEELAFHFGDARLRENSEAMVDELTFRRAIIHAIDRDRIAAEVFDVPTTRLDSILDLFGPNLVDPGLGRYAFDPDRARELVSGLCSRLERDCGADPLRLVITRSTNWDHRIQTAGLIQEMLGEVGIVVEIAERGLGDTLLFEGCGGWEALLLAVPAGFGAAAFNAFRDLYQEFDPARSPNPYVLFEGDMPSFYAWGTGDVTDVEDDPATDDCDESTVLNQGASSVRNEFTQRYRDLAEETRRTPDAAEALPLVLEMDEILADQVVFIPLYAWPTTYAVRDDILGGYGYEFSSFGYQRLWNAAFWYLVQPQPGT